MRATIIKTRKELRFWLQEDAKRNGVPTLRRYLTDLILNNDNAHVYRYLRVLRHCEYHYNNKGLLHKILAALYRIEKGRLGVKYHIDIPLNVVGYGIRLPHVRMGGGNSKRL